MGSAKCFKTVGGAVFLYKEARMKDHNRHAHEMFGGPLTIKTKLPVKPVLAFAAANIALGVALGFAVGTLFNLKKKL